MDSPNIPAATLSPVFSSEAPPKLVGYSVVVEGETVLIVSDNHKKPMTLGRSG